VCASTITLAPRRDTHRLQDDAIGHDITFDSKKQTFFSSRLWRLFVVVSPPTLGVFFGAIRASVAR
jgi:hypothetical protein